MDPVFASLRLSAVGIRAAGYAVESQLRAAQVFGRVAVGVTACLAMPRRTEDDRPEPETATPAVRAVKPAPARPPRRRRQPSPPPMPAGLLPGRRPEG